MDLEQTISELAWKRFGIHALRPYQQLVIQRIIEQDRKKCDHAGILVTLPTGGGKSVCFALPSLLVEGITIIVFPLLSLMNDQLRRFADSNIACICIRGGQSKEERNALFSQLGKGKTRIVVTNAECLSLNAVFKELARHTISLLVLDEAHTIVSWGMGFRPVLADIGLLLAHLEIREILCFTATADSAVVQGLQTLVFKKAIPHMIRDGCDRENLIYHVHRTLSKDHSIACLLEKTHTSPAIVFCATRKETEHAQTAFLLNHPDRDSRYYHAGLSRKSRRALETWYQNSEDGVLFATNAFGMGVDKKNIRTVVHRSLPANVLAYLQESGRGGRDGQRCHCYVLLDGTEREGIPLSIFSSTTCCFREALLKAMGEELSLCSGCDICLSSLLSTREGERYILGSVLLHPLRYTPSRLVQHLRSHIRWDADSGLLDNWRKREVHEALRLLLKEGKLKIAKHTKRRLYIDLRTAYKTLTGKGM